MKKKILSCALCASLMLSGCGGNNSETPAREIQTSVTDSKETVLESYSNDYISFEYDKNLFTVVPSDDGLVLSIECPSMPNEPEGTHNTIMGVINQANDYASDFSEEEAQVLCEMLAKQTCQGLFELNDGESIVNDRTSFSNYCAEYYMEISDGSKCYLKTLNYNSYVTMVFVRVCEYSKDYNDAFLSIYNSAKSNLGNIDFNSTPTSSDSETTPDPDDHAESTHPDPVLPTHSETVSETVQESTQAVSGVTIGQRNALSRAHSYLSFTAFSYSGLIDQLEYEGFALDEATYAADNCGADWNKQASKKAQEYLNFTSFSYSGLIDQLEYEGFTTDQATYAVDNCGADWNEQAAKKAQEYLDYSSFSRQGLIDQLEFEGFTPEQAEFGVTSVGY